MAIPKHNGSDKSLKQQNAIPEPGDADFTFDSFKNQAFRNGWSPETDTPLLRIMFTCYERLTRKASREYNHPDDIAKQTAGIREILSDVMHMRGDIGNRRNYTVTNLKLELYKTADDDLIDALDSAVNPAPNRRKSVQPSKKEEKQILDPAKEAALRKEQEEFLKRMKHVKAADDLEAVFHNQNAYMALNAEERQKLMCDYLRESTLGKSDFIIGSEKKLQENISKVSKYIDKIADGIERGEDALAFIQNRIIEQTIEDGVLKNREQPTATYNDFLAYEDALNHRIDSVNSEAIKGNVALEARQRRLKAEADRVDAFNKRQEGIPFTEKDRQKFKELVRGVRSKAWAIRNHKDSEEIKNLRDAVSDVSIAMYQRSTNEATTPEADIRAKLLEAYKASVAYQTKIRKAAKVAHDNATWEPNSGYGQERYRAARLMEMYARKYIGPDIEAYELNQREKDINTQLGKVTEELPTPKTKDSIPKKSLIAETIAAVQTDFSDPKVMKVKDTHQISKQLAHVLAARIVGEIYAPHVDKMGSLPSKGRYSADRYMRDVKTATKKLSERPDFQKLLDTVSVEDAIALAKTPNVRGLAVRLGGITKTMSKETLHTAPAEKNVSTVKIIDSMKK